MTGALEGRFIVLGVTGSIAAYKAAEIVRGLAADGADVQVLMTPTASRFIGPLTMETLSRRSVMLDPLELLADRRIGHIVAADAADAIVVAPATARWLGAMANGLADDVVTATCLASSAPVIVAPAMDGEMFAHPATLGNVERLRSFGYVIVEPETGALASGQTGQGRLAETGRILEAVRAVVVGAAVRSPAEQQRPPVSPSVAHRDLDGWHVVVTAGGTAEPIDPVRFIGNRSSGKMGIAVAEAALGRGAQVTLIHGTTSVPLPEIATLVHAPTAAEMGDAVMKALPDADALVMAAAVADFRPRAAPDTKLARAAGLTLELEPTDDILAHAVSVARSAHQKTVICGFAAETGSLERAPEKAARKGVDILVANDVSETGSGFGTDTNQVTIIVPGRDPEPWPSMTKRQVAERLIDRILTIAAEKGASSTDGRPAKVATNPGVVR